MNSARLWLLMASTNGFIAVAAGAFGAHGLKSRLTPDMLAIFETAVRYEMYHALALLAVSWLASQRPTRLTVSAGWAFLVGIVLFSGSLFALSLSGIKTFGAVTPLGGVAFLLGWLLLALNAIRSSTPAS